MPSEIPQKADTKANVNVSDPSVVLHPLIGQHLLSPHIRTPCVVVDRSVMQRNCRRMLRAVDALDLGFRVHVKTHKTVQGAEMQLYADGNSNRPARVIVSTVKEAELLLPWLKTKQAGTHAGVGVGNGGPAQAASLIYGIPPSRSAWTGLRKLRQELVPGTVELLFDHPDQVRLIEEAETSAAGERGDRASSGGPGVYSSPIPVWIKVDTGTHRAGVPPASSQLEQVLQRIMHSEATTGTFRLKGFYSHLGISYGGNSPEDALKGLLQEIQIGSEAITKATELHAAALQNRRLTLSVGATPTVASVENLLHLPESQTGRGPWTAADADAMVAAGAVLAEAKARFDVELHAGVYPFLDLQQLATHARPAVEEADSGSRVGSGAGVFARDIAMRLLADVLSIYNEPRALSARSSDDAQSTTAAAQPDEILIGAGVLALGKEPCKAYSGWGALAPAPWRARQEGASKGESPPFDTHSSTGWIVSRLSQEHGILAYNGPLERKESFSLAVSELGVGSRVVIWPNHACITAAGHDEILVVDSEVQDGCEVVDVWTRCRGW